jgi:hypothetical protein
MKDLASDLAAGPEAPYDCPLCPRLVAFRADQRAAHPDWFNGPVTSFGDPAARLLIVGLAPGLKGPTAPGARSPAISPATCSTTRSPPSGLPPGPIAPTRRTGSNSSTA